MDSPKAGAGVAANAWAKAKHFDQYDAFVKYWLNEGKALISKSADPFALGKQEAHGKQTIATAVKVGDSETTAGMPLQHVRLDLIKRADYCFGEVSHYLRVKFATHDDWRPTGSDTASAVAEASTADKVSDMVVKLTTHTAITLAGTILCLFLLQDEKTPSLTKQAVAHKLTNFTVRLELSKTCDQSYERDQSRFGKSLTQNSKIPVMHAS